MWMALPRHGCRSEHPTTYHAPCAVEPQTGHHEWVTNRTDECERSLRRRSYIYGCIRLIESGLRQVHRWYSGSTKDSCQEEQNQQSKVSLHGQITLSAGKGTPVEHRMSNGAFLVSCKMPVFFLYSAHGTCTAPVATV
jgi:hypothetical protein